MKKDIENERRKRWYIRPLWAIWFLLEIIFLQSALASYQELEPRAGAIFAGMFVVLLIGGLAFWFIRRNRLL